MKRTKDIFVVHTKSNPIHRQLHTALSAKLDSIGISVWQYEDWEWKKSRIERDWRFGDEAVELMSDIDKEVFGYRPPRRVQGDVDRATLHSLIIFTPTVLLFELPQDKMTSGAEEEARIIEREFDRFFPLGHFALIRFGTDGHFSCRYPMHCGAVLDMGKDAEITKRTIDQVAMFALQVLIRKDMVSRLWMGRPTSETLEELSEWVAKSKQLVNFCDFMTKLEPDELIVQLVEEILSWMVCLTRKLGADAVWRQAPSLLSWVKGGFNHACRFTDLREDGLLNLVSLLQGAGSSRTETLADILHKPVYRESCNADAVSWRALMESSRGVALAKNRAPTELLMDAVTSGIADDFMRGVFLQGLGRMAEESDREVRQHVAVFMQDLIDASSLDRSAIGECLSAFGRTAESSDAPWLCSFLSQEWSETVQLNALLAIMRIIGENASDIVLGFVDRASPNSRRTIGSASWRINQDRIYNALLTVDPDDQKMIGVVLYALTRAGNPRAYTEAVLCLSSQSSYLWGLAVAFIPQIVNKCNLTHSQIQQLVESTTKLVNDRSEMIRFGAVASLVRCSQLRSVDDANALLRHLLGTGAFRLARSLMINGGLGLPDWPEPRELRLMLFHPSPIIRGTAAFLVGIHKHNDLKPDLEVLQQDPSDVPLIINDNAMKDMGNTVAQCASLALERLSGSIPAPDLRVW